MNEQLRPTMSPWLTKNVMSSRKGRLFMIEASSHHGVGCIILPEGLMNAEMPVFAQRAMARRVSMARRDA